MTPAATALASRSEYTWPVDFGKSRRIQQTVSTDHFLETSSLPSICVQRCTCDPIREAEKYHRVKNPLRKPLRVYEVFTKGKRGGRRGGGKREEKSKEQIIVDRFDSIG